MSEIGRHNLDLLLQRLGDELAHRGASAHLVVIGGSALIAAGVVDRTTRDVDIVALQVEGLLTAAEPLPADVQDAALAVARSMRVGEAWLNAGPTSLLTTASGLPEGFAARASRRTYGEPLVVDFADRLDLIFFKLYALADRGAARDVTDLRALQPTAEELRAAARWARTHNMPGAFDALVAHALAQFGVDDDGRDPASADA